MSALEPLQAICFSKSYLNWLTRAEASHGWFQLDALLEWIPLTIQQPLHFVQAASIPAGRMYAQSSPLLIQPPYSFQLISGLHEHTILRRPLDLTQPAVPADSSQRHIQKFKRLSWKLSHCPAEALHPEALVSLSSPPPCLNLLLEWKHKDGLLRLQAPLRHWNHRADPTGWQIETGPLIWPLDLLAFVAAPSSALLTSAWLHANQVDRVTISGDRLPCHELETQLSLLALI